MTAAMIGVAVPFSRAAGGLPPALPGWPYIIRSPAFSAQFELSLLHEPPQQATCLVRGQRAQLGGFSPGDLAMSIDVLQDHLLLLQRLEAVYPDVAGRGVKHSVNRCGQVPAPSFPVAPRLYP